MAFTGGDTREIEELVESLRFVALKIPTKCAIQHILLPENISYTFIDIFIGDEFNGNLPDDIKTIKVSFSFSSTVTHGHLTFCPPFFESKKVSRYTN